MSQQYYALKGLTCCLTSLPSARLGVYPSLAFLPYGKRFLKHRRLFHTVFSRAQNHTFEETQTEEARFLLRSLIEKGTPESYDWLVRRLACFAIDESYC